VTPREVGKENPNLATGAVEIEAATLEILNPSRALPFQIDQEGNAPVNEETRLKYRYLDLRRPAMYEKMRLRHEAVRRMRAFLYERGFLEVETPVMTKSTPEGARDYLVPYRCSPACSTRCPRRRSSSSSCSWSAASSVIFRSPSASATRRSGRTASRSSRNSTSKCPSSPRTTCWT
jgi:hypothetical protein